MQLICIFFIAAKYLIIKEFILAFYNQDIKQIFKDLKSSENGIDTLSVNERKQAFGTNELEKQKKLGFFKRFLLQFKNIMIIILLLSSMLSLFVAITHKDTENLFEAILILVIVIVNAFVGVIQEQKAENTLAALKSSVEPFASVIRNGKHEKIRIHELVVGDVVTLKTGDKVPADIRLFECNHLECNESSLTGESHNIQKSTMPLTIKNVPLQEQCNICFSGTSVTGGKGTGIVVAVGKNTELGKIAKALSVQTKQKTPLEKNIHNIGKFLTISILIIVGIVFVLQVLFNKSLSPIDALLTSVALAVAAIPESLPAIITIIMALGVQRLARKNAIIKKLSAVETLGSCNVICSDKTGTLTKNQMVVKHIFDNGKIFSAEDYNTTNTDLISCAALCNNIILSKDGSLISDATEKSIGVFLKEKHIDIFNEKIKSPEIAENEFSSAKKIMGKLCKTADHNTLFVKGALDYILPLCDFYFENGDTKPLTGKERIEILKANNSLCKKGERVIAFAIKKHATSVTESALTFVGFLGIIDPPKKESFNAIKSCKNAGLKPIMITGDHPTTAFAIASDLNIATSKNEVLTGEKIDKLSTKELSKIILNYSVFARVTPEHKLKIVSALKENKKIVAMSGDGVNDAPSIKSADIGVCMGKTGTDVTKEAADIIVSDDNFATIVLAIKEGRTIYENISKAITFLLSTNIVEVLGIFVTSLVMPNYSFLLPVQILFINLVTDSLPAFALGIEPPEESVMETPPRDANKSILSGKTGTLILYEGFIQSLAVLVMFAVCCHLFSAETASTMSFITICLMQIIHAINCKSEKSIFKTNIFSNKFFNFSFLFLLALILGVYFVPMTRAIFSLSTLSLREWLIISLTSLSIIPLVEIGKFFISKKEMQ